MIKRKNYLVESLLGLGLGFGYLTSLRFVGPVGLPEIFVLLALFALIFKNPYLLFRYKKNKESAFRAYIVFSNVIILPLVTCLVVLFSVYNYGSAPQYVISFIIAITLMFYIVDAIVQNKIDMPLMVKIFAFAFIASNFIAIYFFGELVGNSYDLRYTGGAENPNQLIFYAATLSLLVVVYLEKLSIYLIPLIIYIVFKAKSDAYNLMLFVILICYIIFVIFFASKKNFRYRLFSFISFCLVGFLLIITNYSQEISLVWLAADEGDLRTSLIKNALEALYLSPLTGFGAGSFSGIDNPFDGSEAHNTFLDFAVQFGIAYSLLIYWLIFNALFICLRKRQILIAAFIMGFIVSGLFHFSARHFVFWVELAVLYYYVFYSGEKLRDKNLSQTSFI